MNPRVAAAGAAVFLILLVVAFSGSQNAHEAARVNVAGAPSYCGTKATERLPECGWTEVREKTPVAVAAAPEFPQERLDAMAALVRINGYSCKTPISARNMLFNSSGYVLHCEGDHPNSDYWFDIEDRGGHLVVRPS